MKWRVGLILAFLITSAAACGGNENKKVDNVVYITATPQVDGDGHPIIWPTMTPPGPTDTPVQPTPNPTRVIPQSGGEYIIQAGDSLLSVAQLYGVGVEAIIALNPQIADPNALEIGQTVNVPGGVTTTGPNFKLVPDSELVYGPTASEFSIASFVKGRQGFLRAYSELIDEEPWSGIEIIDFVAKSYSVNPRLLLAILEYRSGWLTNPYPGDQAINYPMGIIKEGREGLLRQMLDAADALNAGYYGWKYRGNITLTFVDGVRIFYAPDINAGTVAVQYMLSLSVPSPQWQLDVAESGFFQTYLAFFGDPFTRAIDPLVPPDIQQPMLTLPFAKGEEWVYTGGPHGAYNSGSGWSAVDFAPPEPPEELIMAQGSCYISPHWVTAVAGGVIARSGNGYVILDLDGDGNEHTGWVLVYLHIDDFEVIEQGKRVQAGDRLGHPSCMGGVSNGTHLHFARRYNGEWIPAICEECAPGVTVPPMVLGEWTMLGYPNQEYQGYMTRAGDDGYRQAEQTRDYTMNKVSW